MTLTYAPRDDLADKVLTHEHVQAFVRSLRDTHHKIRYLVTGEYGKLRGRAHFHIILFGKGKRLQVPQKRKHHIPHWPHGHVFADWDADERSIRYVVKYILKDNSEESWFSLSKKPTLGSEWFQQKAKQVAELGALPSSFEYMPPGGHKGRPYLMTGATRRDYIAAVFDAFAKKQTLRRDRLSEWVLKGLEKLEYQNAVKYRESLPQDEQLEGLEERLDRARPTISQLQKLKLATDNDAVQFTTEDLKGELVCVRPLHGAELVEDRQRQKSNNWRTRNQVLENSPRIETKTSSRTIAGQSP